MNIKIYLFAFFVLAGFSSTVLGQSGFNPPKTNIPTPLTVQNIGIDTVRVLDSVRVYFQQDTTHTGILNAIYNKLDTTHTGVLNDINSALDTTVVRIDSTNRLLEQFAFLQCGGNALLTTICGAVEIDSNQMRKVVSIDNLPPINNYNINETFDVNNSTIILPSGTYHSYTVTGISGTFDLTEQGTVTGIPSGVTITKTATTTFDNTVTIVTTGRILVNTLR